MIEKNIYEQSLSFGILLVNYKGRILYTNDYFEKMLNLSAKQIKEKMIQHIIPKSNIIKVIKEGNADITTYGNSQYANLIEFPIKLSKLGIIIKFPNDFLQSFIVKSPAMSNLKKEIESIMNLTGELVTITESDGLILRVSSNCERIMGLKEHEFVGKSAFQLEKKGVINFSSTRKVIDTKQPIRLEQVTQSGRKLLVDGHPIFNEDGTLSKVVNISKDVTEVDDLKNKLEEVKNTLRYYQQELNKVQKKAKDIVVKSKAMEKVYDLVNRVADFDATIFIQGETGVGKEVLARTIHQLSSRKNAPFIKVNCGAIPESLMESEFFGYSKGTFTGGSKEGKKGLVVAANKGMLFLDEIGELPLNLQAKLLQVLQEKEFTPLGNTTPVKVDVRFITATNRDLEEMVREGTFREDLYYRLFVIPITIPPLAERKQDIPFLVEHFVDFYNEKYKTAKSIDKDVVQLFMDHEWKGNVRELQNTIERLILTVPNEQIQIKHLPEKMIRNTEAPTTLNLKDAMNHFEKKIILQTLKESKTMKEVSEKLGVDLSTISRKIKKYEIDFAKMQ
ncbi:sigma 54-interacting transcriptional regulator [Jeotgalibacillus soli]|uniref:HTH-type transcriptional regulatory protein TyrR n=1 Tax=Jeotgalibacillus soli TaxID=889306 RepID=A0A0C2VKV1_9BACL|nr:sigma 54-interacting transcriptional regulator [Jeotgalibacillus soli]KIL44608.1 hypothetical protein KP78_35720 [Jeotgalibacillus soli]